MNLRTIGTRKSVLATLAVVALASFPAAWAQTAQLGGVQTSVDLDLGFLGALGDLGVTPAPIFPATLMGTTASFPIPGGVVDTSNLRGDIFHTGGLSLTAGMTKVELLNFVIDTTGPAELTGAVALNGALVDRLPLFDLDLMNASVLSGPYGTLEISGVVLTLTDGAAEALNMIFGIDDLTGGLLIGEATVLAQTFGGDDGDDEGNDENSDDETLDDYGMGNAFGKISDGSAAQTILRDLGSR